MVPTGPRKLRELGFQVPPGERAATGMNEEAIEA
jgi:hypothetical protein